MDMDRDRKNIAVAYIFGAASERERRSLTSLSGETLYSLIMELYKKYSIYDEICDEARALEQRTYDLIAAQYQLRQHAGSLNDFKAFVHEMVEICFSKLR